MAKHKFNLEIISPNRVFYAGDVLALSVRTTEGDMGIMHDHQPMVVPISSGPLNLKFDEKSSRLAALFGGFCQVSLEGDVTIICEHAEWADEIDKNRAERAKKRAEERLAKNEAEVDFERARAALSRAITRLNISGHNLGGK